VDLETAIVALLDQHHRAQPMSEGVPRDDARERVFRRGHAAVFDRAVEALAAAGTIAARDRLSLASHRHALSPADEHARDAIERVVRDGGLTPADPASLAARAGVPAATAEAMVRLLQRQKRLVKIEALLFHEDALAALKARVAALKSGPEARIDVATFKERFGVSRKFAIPLLEYLDRERVTRRVGDARVIL
jgi:selenocysteine-specific elongation factor